MPTSTAGHGAPSGGGPELQACINSRDRRLALDLPGVHVRPIICKWLAGATTVVTLSPGSTPTAAPATRCESTQVLWLNLPQLQGPPDWRAGVHAIHPAAARAGRAGGAG